MGKKLVLALALVALMAAPAFASVQNVKVGGDLKTTSVIRNNFIAGNLQSGASAQKVVLSQIGLNIQADLTDNVSTTLRLVNEKIWGDDDTGTANGIELEAAYVTMKELLYSPLTVVVGRQPLVYGNKFIIGDVNGYGDTDIASVSDLGNNKNADAIKAVLNYDPLTVDLFAAKISEGTSETTVDKDDTDLYGINANFKLGDKSNSVIEAYTFILNNKSVVAAAKANKIYVPGLRISSNPIEGISTQLEAAYQTGTSTPVAPALEKQKIGAFGIQGMVNYALPILKDLKPGLSAAYTYLSGDKDTTNNKGSAWQIMYPDQNGGRIFNALPTATYGSNVKIANLALEMTPMQDVTTKLSWYNLTKVKKGTTSNKLGNEVDLDVTYAYTEDVTFGLSSGIFAPGKAYAATTTRDNAFQVLTSVAVAF